jgi:FkbM family methyltransferase
VLIKVKLLFYGFSRKSYSQFGEDLVLATFLDVYSKKNGFYVDIGAYQPKKFSNTFFYYKKGWHGINIDAKPGSMKPFIKKRKRDINLEVGISVEEKEIEFNIFEESAFNTFSRELAESSMLEGIRLKEKVLVTTARLESVLDKYVAVNQRIDFMSVDVEGFDLEVLKSNNWDKYKPEYILAEMHNVDIVNIENSLIYQYLANKGYKLVSVVYVTLIFKYAPIIKF